MWAQISPRSGQRFGRPDASSPSAGLAKSSSQLPQPALVNISGKLVDGLFVVFQVVAPIDLLFSSLDPGKYLGLMHLFVQLFVNKSLYSLADKGLRTIVFAAGDLFLNEFF